ncbi:MAG: DUF3268 family zinc-finger domain-containing protein [Clostridiales bacterium]|nr:DUF3268 family zinc-finger domain-containing protein [Clostridiales bacterium]
MTLDRQIKVKFKNAGLSPEIGKEYKDACRNFSGYVKREFPGNSGFDQSRACADSYIRLLDSDQMIPAHDVRHHAYALAFLFGCSPDSFGKTRLDESEHPKTCNLCGGDVVFTSNAEIYGREYGSGKCYLCTSCRSFVGTHKPWPDEAMGILADHRMRDQKKRCHALFDPMWNTGTKKGKKRTELYKELAGRMGIRPEDCHFGLFDKERLAQTYDILLQMRKERGIYG